MGKAKANELNLDVKVWAEGGKSSNHDDLLGRPVLNSLLQAIKSGEVKHLWVYDQTRLSRKDNIASIFRYEMNKASVKLYTKDGNYDLSNSSDKFLQQILDAVAELENSARAERSRIGKIHKVRQGYWHGGPPPYGYELKNGKLSINLEESKWIKVIFKNILSGENIPKIKHLLDMNGVLARRGKLWTLGSINSTLKNTHYIGRYIYTDNISGEKIEVSCPKIIDELTWHTIELEKNQRRARVKQQNATTKHFYLLRDLMFCGHCGRKISGRIKPSKSEYFYYCPNKERKWVDNAKSETHYQRKSGCGFERSMNIKVTDKVVFDTVLDLHAKSSVLKETVKQEVYKKYGIKAGASIRETENIKKELKKQEKETERLSQVLSSLEATNLMGKNTVTNFDKVAKQIKEEVEKSQLKVNNLRSEMKGNLQKKQWISWVKMFGEDLDAKKDLLDTERQTYLKGLIEKIEARYIENSGEHELTLYFNLPIVGDGIKWVDENDKFNKGYLLVEGGKEFRLNVEKRDNRGK